jgi:hypothetical protein
VIGRAFVVVSGLPGSRKSTVGRALSEHLALPVFDKDVILALRSWPGLPRGFACAPVLRRGAVGVHTRARSRRIRVASGRRSAVALFPARCPVAPREQAWIEKMLLWCVERFGEVPLRGRVVEPTHEFFPGRYLGTRQDVLQVVDRVRALLGISADRFTVEVASDPDVPAELDGVPLHPTRRVFVAGHYRQRDGRSIQLLTARGSRRD